MMMMAVVADIGRVVIVMDGGRWSATAALPEVAIVFREQSSGDARDASAPAYETLFAGNAFEHEVAIFC